MSVVEALGRAAHALAAGSAGGGRSGGGGGGRGGSSRRRTPRLLLLLLVWCERGAGDARAVEVLASVEKGQT